MLSAICSTGVLGRGLSYVSLILMCTWKWKSKLISDRVVVKASDTKLIMALRRTLTLAISYTGRTHIMTFDLSSPCSNSHYRVRLAAGLEHCSTALSHSRERKHAVSQGSPIHVIRVGVEGHVTAAVLHLYVGSALSSFLNLARFHCPL